MANVKKETSSFSEKAYGFLGFNKKSSGLQKSKSFDLGNSFQKLRSNMNAYNSKKATSEKSTIMEDEGIPHTEDHSFMAHSPSERKGPGLASRVSSRRPVSMVIPTTGRDSPEHFVEDMSERLFVKMDVERLILPSKDEIINGTLLITPKMLMFDPEVDEDSSSKQAHTSQLRQTVALPLANIVAMNTHASLDMLLQDKSPKYNNPSRKFGQLGDTSRLPSKYTKIPVDNNAIETEQSLDDAAGQQESTDDSSPTAPEELSSTKSTPEDQSSPTEPPSSLYLCLRGTTADAETPPSPSESCVESFVFLVPRDNIDELYAFLSQFATDMQDTSSPTLSSSLPGPIRSDLDLVAEYESSPPKDSLVADALKELEEEQFRPQLRGGASEILVEPIMIDELATCFPIHLTGANLNLMFKTSRDGFSLNTIYRTLKDVNNCVVLLIKDISNTCFGAVMSEKMHCSQYFYGKGESVVFSWKDSFKKYTWTNKNNFFMKGDSHCFSIGAKSGHNAIWFDDNLKNGRSEPTDTFGNPTLSGESGSAFLIECLEVWSFVS